MKEMTRRKVKLEFGYGFLFFLLLQFSLLVFVNSENVGMKRKRSTDSYYNAYSRPDYNTKSNSRQLTSSSTGSSYYDSQVGEDFGNYAAASHSSGYGGGGGGHGGGHGGGGYGGGGGHGGGGGGYGHGGGGGHGKGSNVNSSAVGLLGFLALLSLIQNVLRQMTTTAAPTMAPMGRKKRSFNDSLPIIPSSAVDDARITTLVLPMLTAVAHAKDGLVPHDCVHRPVCLANKVLVDQLGDHGTSIGTLVTNAVGKLLHPYSLSTSYDSIMEKDDMKSKYKNKKNPSDFGGKNSKKTTTSTSLTNRNREKLIEAGKNGRRKNSKGGECDSYEYCNVLNNLPVYGLPPSGQFV